MARMNLNKRERLDMLVSGAVDGVEKAAAQLQPLTVDQERHHVERVDGEQASVKFFHATLPYLSGQSVLFYAHALYPTIV